MSEFVPDKQQQLSKQCGTVLLLGQGAASDPLSGQAYAAVGRMKCHLSPNIVRTAGYWVLGLPDQ